MQQGNVIAVAQQLETMGVDIVRGGFASWIRDDLGFQASDEGVDRALVRVQKVVADGRAASVHDLAYHIAAAMTGSMSIDAFGGSAWSMDE